MFHNRETISDEKVKEVLWNDFPFRSETRKTILEDAYETGHFSYDHRKINAHIAWAANEFFAEFFGSRDYGFKVKTAQHNSNVYLKHDDLHGHDYPTIGDYTRNFRRAHSELQHLGKREFKNEMIHRILGWVHEVVNEARAIDLDAQEQQMEEDEGGMGLV